VAHALFGGMKDDAVHESSADHLHALPDVRWRHGGRLGEFLAATRGATAGGEDCQTKNSPSGTEKSGQRIRLHGAQEYPNPAAFSKRLLRAVSVCYDAKLARR